MVAELKPVRTENTSVYLAALERQIDAFECRYETSTIRMAEMVDSGQRAETAEISTWMHLANLKALLVAGSTPGSTLSNTGESTKRR